MKSGRDIDFNKPSAALYSRSERAAELREHFANALARRVASAVIYPTPNSPSGAFCVLFENKNGEVILNELARRGIKAATLSPCAGRAEYEASFLGRADIPHSLAMGSILFSLDENNTEDEIDVVVEQLEVILLML